MHIYIYIYSRVYIAQEGAQHKLFVGTFRPEKCLEHKLMSLSPSRPSLAKTSVLFL